MSNGIKLTAKESLTMPRYMLAAPLSITASSSTSNFKTIRSSNNDIENQLQVLLKQPNSNRNTSIKQSHQSSQFNYAKPIITKINKTSQQDQKDQNFQTFDIRNQPSSSQQNSSIKIVVNNNRDSRNIFSAPIEKSSRQGKIKVGQQLQQYIKIRPLKQELLNRPQSVKKQQQDKKKLNLEDSPPLIPHKLPCLMEADMQILEDVDKFFGKPYTRPQTGFQLEDEYEFKNQTIKLRDNITGVKHEVRNMMRQNPKGFQNLGELDKYLRTNRIEVQDPFASVNPRRKFIENIRNKYTSMNTLRMKRRETMVNITRRNTLAASATALRHQSTMNVNPFNQSSSGNFKAAQTLQLLNPQLLTMRSQKTLHSRMPSTAVNGSKAESQQQSYFHHPVLSNFLTDADFADIKKRFYKILVK
eukprot:403355762